MELTHDVVLSPITRESPMKNVSFVPYSPFDKGAYPSIAVNANGLVVEGHQRQGDSSLYYNVGSSGNDAISFNTNSGTYFDMGAPPRFAINDHNWAVEMHKSNGPKDNLWYHVGLVNATDKTWAFGDSHSSGNGQDPDIALNNHYQVAAVHENDGTIKCRLGTVDTSKKTISFQNEFDIDSGTTPTVAMTDSGKVLVIYRSSTYNNLQYWLGQISGNSISKTGSGWTASGKNPSVGMNEDGFVVVGFTDEDETNIYSYPGILSGSAIGWNAASQYAYGEYPWVDVKGNYAVQVFPSDDLLDYSLLASQSTVYNRATWMGDNPNIQTLSLSQLVFPGSHDAGMSMHQDCTFYGTQCNTRTQYVDIGMQLELGSRYFDIRPVIYNETFYTGHYADSGIPGIGIQGCNGQSLDSLLDQAASFLNEPGHELAVLKFSHYYDKDANKLCFSETQMNDLISLVKTKLAGLLYINTEATQRLADRPLREVTVNGSRAIAVFQFCANKASDDGAGMQCQCADTDGPLCVPGSNSADPASGIYSYADYCHDCPPSADLTVYDQYSKTNDLDTMMNNQWSKQGDVNNHGGDLFLLSWTLTQSNTQATACGITWLDSIVALADTADAQLYAQCVTRYGDGLITQGNIPNILYADLCNGFATDVAIYLNAQLWNDRVASV